MTKKKVDSFKSKAFRSLLAENTREDGWINATVLCKEFTGKRLHKFWECSYVKDYIEKAEQIHLKRGNLETLRGKGGGTYIHPSLISRFVRWLDVELEFIGEEVQRLYWSDPEALTIALINQNDDFDSSVRIANAASDRRDYLYVYHGLHDEMKLRDANEHYHHINIAKALIKHTGIKAEEVKTKEQYDERIYYQLNACVKLRTTDAIGNAAVKVILASFENSHTTLHP